MPRTILIIAHTAQPDHSGFNLHRRRNLRQPIFIPALLSNYREPFARARSSSTQEKPVIWSAGAGRLWAMLLAGGAAAFVAIQFIRPAISNPPVTADLQAPSDVKRILRTSCYDCHSNQTRLRWFDQIAPAYWLVEKDVRNGRSRLNFSDFGNLPAAQQKGALYESVNQIRLGGMPLGSYLRVHRNARVSPADLAVLTGYLRAPVDYRSATAGELTADDAQYEKWIRGDASPHTVAPAPNGIEFLPDYKSWKAISSTDRFDNQTMRVILGNDTAIRAIAGNHVNPWPDGTAFAKVAWFARDEGQGRVHPGAFFQVEFMIRDSRKYAATKNWGWARWRGSNLEPYGKDATFTDECVGCHLPLKNSDFVYTMPLRGQR